MPDTVLSASHTLSLLILPAARLLSSCFTDEETEAGRLSSDADGGLRREAA